ncbi:MAG: hypothetical protein HY815_23660, partial [Candidatus Riflebacteria bacterium]|nr:hypothetical protein [Candidatus Riflebacteria bacterium]
DTYQERDKAGPTTLSFLALSLAKAGRTEEAKVCLRNLENHAVTQKENDTTRLGKADGYSFWWEDGVETTALGLRAHLAADPGSDTARRLMRWLVLNRRGSRWKSTRDTASAVYALVDWISGRRENAEPMQLVITLNGKSWKTVDIPASGALDFDGNLDLPADQLLDGDNTLEITKSGGGTLYYSSYLEYFTLEEDIKGTGDEILVKRSYSRLKNVAKPGVAESELHERAPMEANAVLEPGELVEVELAITARNNYEYLMFEDPKPAGCETVEKLSGARSGGESSGLADEFRLQIKE